MQVSSKDVSRTSPPRSLPRKPESPGAYEQRVAHSSKGHNFHYRRLMESRCSSKTWPIEPLEGRPFSFWDYRGLGASCPMRHPFKHFAHLLQAARATSYSVVRRSSQADALPPATSKVMDALRAWLFPSDRSNLVESLGSVKSTRISRTLPDDSL